MGQSVKKLYTLNRLWAPWRLTYIQTSGEKGKKCVFCRAAHSKNDTQNLILLRKKLTFSLLNLYPYNNGHLLVLPYRHINDITLLSQAEQRELFAHIQLLVKISKKVLRPHGFNIGINQGSMAGAGIQNHIHIHIVPRWKGDTNFLPIIANTRVISQSLNDLQTRMKNALRKHK